MLERGFAIAATAGGEIVQDAAHLQNGDALTLTFARGGAEAVVTQPRPVPRDDPARER